MHRCTQCTRKQSLLHIPHPAFILTAQESTGSPVTHGCTKAPTCPQQCGWHMVQPVPALWRLPEIQIRAAASTRQVLEYQLPPWDRLDKVPVQTNFTGSIHTAVTELGLVYLQNCYRGRSRKAVPACVLTAVSHLGTATAGAVTGGMPLLSTQHFQHKCQKLSRIFGWINCSDSNLKPLKHREKWSQGSSPRGEALEAASYTEDW